MDYLAQLNAFADYSMENLNCNEVSVYMRLLFLNNRLRWKEWFSVTHERLVIETNLKSVNTVKTTINALEQKGYIKIKRHKGKKPNDYSIIQLYKPSKIDTLDTDKTPISKTNLSNFDGLDTDKTLVKDCLDADKTLIKGGIIRHRQDEEKDVDDSRATTTANFSSAVKFFDDNFHAITPHEFDVLGSLVDDFGEAKTLRAMTLAVERDARNIRYVKAVLEGWERDGGENAPKSDGGEKPDEWQTRGNWTQYTDEEAAELLRRDEERRAANKARQEAEYEAYKARADRRAKERAKWLNWQPPA